MVLYFKYFLKALTALFSLKCATFKGFSRLKQKPFYSVNSQLLICLMVLLHSCEMITVAAVTKTECRPPGTEKDVHAECTAARGKPAAFSPPTGS